MKFKNLILTMVAILAFISGFAQKNESGKGLSKYPLGELIAGNHDEEVVNEAGMTGKEVTALLDAYCKEFAGVSLKDFYKKSSETKIQNPHYNTQVKWGGITTYYDRTPSGHAKHFGNAHIKVECANIIGPEAGSITNFLKDYASKSKDASQSPPIYKPTDPNKDQNNNNQNQNNMDTLKIIVDQPSQNSDAGSNVGLIILGIIGLLMILGIVVYALSNRGNDRNNAVAQVIADQNAFLNSHYQGIGQFVMASNNMHNSVTNGQVQTIQTLRGLNNNLPPAQPANPPVPPATTPAVTT